MTRCFVAAIGLSAVFGGIAYGTLENRYEVKEQKLRQLAMKACIELGPPYEKEDPQAISAQLDLCNYGHPGYVGPTRT